MMFMMMASTLKFQERKIINNTVDAEKPKSRQYFKF